MQKLPQHISKLIKYHRKKLGLSQYQLAEKTGIDRRRISSLEHKKRKATPVEASSLKMTLGLGDFTCDLASRVCPVSEPPNEVYLPQGNRHFMVRLATARRMYPQVTPVLEEQVALRTDSGEIVDFLDDLKLDSSLEAVVVLRLLAAGARVTYESPGMHGYWGDDIVEPEFYRTIVSHRRPALVTDSLVVFPQVSFAAGRLIRVDFLVRQRNHGVWAVVEIDGPGHQPDHSREPLVHRVLRFNEQEVLSDDFYHDLVARLWRRAA